jgi:hypothetical protein
MRPLYTIIAILGWTALSSIIGSIVLIAVGKAAGSPVGHGGGDGFRTARTQHRSMPCRTHDEGATNS